MAVDDQVAVGAVLVLADLGVEQGSLGQLGEALRQEAPRPGDPLGMLPTLTRLLLEQLPLTSSGKIDRKALPAAQARTPASVKEKSAVIVR